ncbi:MAG: SURF1 family protein [Aquabacterium sp.]
MTLTPLLSGLRSGRRSVVVALAALLTAAATCALGLWQLSRADAKAEQAHRIALQSALPAWTSADWPCHADAAGSLPLQRPVRLRGQWWHERTVLLDNRSMDGRSGLIVVTPLKLSGAPRDCAGAVVLIQRGWIPRDPGAPRDLAHLPAVPRPAGLVEVQGRLIAEPARVYAIGQEAPPSGQAPLLRQNVDNAFWRQWLGQSPLAGTVLQLQAESALSAVDAAAPDAPAADGLWRQWPGADHGRGKHLGYAAQWFAMAALIVGLYVWHQLLRPRRASARDSAQDTVHEHP